MNIQQPGCRRGLDVVHGCAEWEKRDAAAAGADGSSALGKLELELREDLPLQRLHILFAGRIFVP
jgi:hypothetical protein